MADKLITWDLTDLAIELPEGTNIAVFYGALTRLVGEFDGNVAGFMVPAVEEE